MNHAAAQQLNVTLALAHTATLAAAGKAGYVHFRTGLCEGEMMGTETNLCILTEQLLRKNCQCTLQIAHSYVLINYHAFQLMEYRGMGCIHLIGTIYRTGANHTDRQLALLHGTHLHGRGLCTQQNIPIDIEGILFILCRMVCRNIQRLKVIVVLFHLRAVCHLVAHALENIADFVDHNAHGVLMPFGSFLPRHGYVDFFCLQSVRQFCRLQTFLAFLQHFFNALSYFIRHLPDDRSFLCGKLAHFLQNGSQLALLTQKFHL